MKNWLQKAKNMFGIKTTKKENSEIDCDIQMVQAHEKPNQHYGNSREITLSHKNLTGLHKKQIFVYKNEVLNVVVEPKNFYEKKTSYIFSKNDIFNLSYDQEICRSVSLKQIRKSITGIEGIKNIDIINAHLDYVLYSHKKFDSCKENFQNEKSYFKFLFSENSEKENIWQAIHLVRCITAINEYERSEKQFKDCKNGWKEASYNRIRFYMHRFGVYLNFFTDVRKNLRLYKKNWVVYRKYYEKNDKNSPSDFKHLQLTSDVEQILKGRNLFHPIMHFLLFFDRDLESVEKDFLNLAINYGVGSNKYHFLIDFLRNHREKTTQSQYILTLFKLQNILEESNEICKRINLRYKLNKNLPNNVREEMRLVHCFYLFFHSIATTRALCTKSKKQIVKIKCLMQRYILSGKNIDRTSVVCTLYDEILPFSLITQIIKFVRLGQKLCRKKESSIYRCFPFFKHFNDEKGIFLVHETKKSEREEYISREIELISKFRSIHFYFNLHKFSKNEKPFQLYKSLIKKIKPLRTGAKDEKNTIAFTYPIIGNDISCFAFDFSSRGRILKENEKQTDFLDEYFNFNEKCFLFFKIKSIEKQNPDQSSKLKKLYHCVSEDFSFFKINILSGGSKNKNIKNCLEISQIKKDQDSLTEDENVLYEEIRINFLKMLQMISDTNSENFGCKYERDLSEKIIDSFQYLYKMSDSFLNSKRKLETKEKSLPNEDFLNEKFECFFTKHLNEIIGKKY